MTCTGYRKLCGSKKCKKCFNLSLASDDKCKGWSKKNACKPINVFKNSGTKYLFDCTNCKHHYSIAPCYVKADSCPYCVIQAKVLCYNKKCITCRERSFASTQQSQYWSIKNEKTARQTFKFANSIGIFDCKCGHEFTSRVADITDKNSWCPFCANKTLCNNNNCVQCVKNSFASCPQAENWSNKNTDKPRDVFKNSNSKYIFDCNICKHEYDSTLNNITTGGNGCPFCAHAKLCNNENCEYCFNNSFASSKRATYWSQDNKLNPRQVAKHTNTKYIFNCDCGHVFEKNLADISRKNDGWCPYCANQKLCKDRDCIQCFNNSFWSNPKSKYWSKENKKHPRDVARRTDEKFKFDCPDCKLVYEATPDNIEGGSWCYCVKKKTEIKLFSHLQNNYDFQISRQKAFPWCKNIKSLIFDFVIEDLKIIIELDGNQHFLPIKFFNCDPFTNQTNDKYKMKCANNNGYTVIRILQTHVWHDKSDWQEDLKSVIKKYDKPKKIYIGDIYNGTYYNCDK